MKDQIDETTILDNVYKMTDTQAIRRRRRLDITVNHPVAQLIEAANAFEEHADYLERMGDTKQAARFRMAAKSLDAQMQIPPAGAAKPTEAVEAEAARAAGAPEEKPRVSPRVAPPEEGAPPQPMRGG